ncbi:hypothetical protein CF65_02096 [Aggregatibacter actinomycetemcomitans HK1651]|nr:hypothetical protein CF65_02096 [Aggregatibacter actinomycetemcomitans HK1651]
MKSAVEIFSVFEVKSASKTTALLVGGFCFACFIPFPGNEYD